ncbi:HepT-like ribonuclease domain-containing protein [Desulfovermiculus halophilus]|uniref:HepT-like ribonuclease domain-containing protein n=1 Tax=Desulfovermiculus halophilus TaxID=339722 RepID=UPI001ABFAD5F|nr:DUF86 domain-containing protein [Desulfovermiculus halophilus]
MIRDYRDYLQDILTSIEESLEFTEGMTFDAFSQDRKTINAVVRSLEVLGEATKRIPENLRSQAPSIPWKYMAGMRDNPHPRILRSGSWHRVGGNSG